MERCGGHVQQRQDAHGQDEDASKVHEPTSGQDVSTLVVLAVPQRIRVVQLVVGLWTIEVGRIERKDILRRNAGMRGEVGRQAVATTTHFV